MIGYYDAWAFSSAAKLLGKAIDKSGKAGTFILAGAVVIGGILLYKKIDVVNERLNDYFGREK
ncbi:MAG: hypothetical protein J6Y20_05555 [Lachnospiraceae bacterium]|nr:hypothetical protein [Lachnospiraceae bacterium]